MVHIGFIGLGQMGLIHAQAFAQVPGCRIVGGADVSPTARESFGKRFPDVTLYDNHATMLADAIVDAVVISLPTLLHKQVAIAAMLSGCAVLVEKPMARTVADCRRMIDISKQTGQLLMIGQCRRYDKHWDKLTRLVQQGKLGRPILWKSIVSNYKPGRWFMDERLGGGPTIDCGVHYIDYANKLFGEPAMVLASSIKLSNDSAIDTAVGIVRYKSGDQLLLNWSWGANGGMIQELLGPKGTLTLDADGMETNDAKPHLYFCLTEPSRKKRLIKTPGRFADVFVAQARHFVQCIKGKATCLSPGKEAIKAVIIAEAILKMAPRGGSRKFD